MSSVGTLYFYGENLFFVKLRGIPRDKKLLQLTKELIDERRILEPYRIIINENILDKAPEIKSTNLALFFFNPKAKDERGSNLSEIEAMYIANQLKGDPLALTYLSLLDKDNTFIKKYPSISLYENDNEFYSLSFIFSEMPSIEGLNIATTSARRQSGYFPKDFWFSGIVEERI